MRGALRRGDPGADRPAPVADGHHRLRRSGRPVVARREGRGGLRAAARGRAGDLRRRSDLDPPPAARPAGIWALNCDAAHPPRPPGHGLVAGRAAIRDQARPRPAGRRGPAGGGRLDLERGRALAALGAGGICRRPPRSRSATSRSLRQSRWREAIASIFDDPDFLPYLRSLRPIRGHLRDPRRGRARPARRTLSSPSTTSGGSPRG